MRAVLVINDEDREHTDFADPENQTWDSGTRRATKPTHLAQQHGSPAAEFEMSTAFAWPWYSNACGVSLDLISSTCTEGDSGETMRQVVYSGLRSTCPKRNKTRRCAGRWEMGHGD